MLQVHRLCLDNWNSMVKMAEWLIKHAMVYGPSCNISNSKQLDINSFIHLFYIPWIFTDMELVILLT